METMISCLAQNLVDTHRKIKPTTTRVSWRIDAVGKYLIKCNILKSGDWSSSRRPGE